MFSIGRPRKKLSAGRYRCPHHQGHCSCRPHSYSTPSVSGHWPVSFALASCGRACRPACALTAASVYMDFLSCVPPSVLRCRSHRKGFLPHSCGVFRRWHAPINFGTFCPEVWLLAVLTQPGYSCSDGHSVFKVLSIDELP